MFIFASRSFVETGMLLIPRRVGWMAQFLSHIELFFFTVAELHCLGELPCA
jgi:hypothetical protein